VNPLSLGMVDTSIIDGRFKSKEGIDSARAFLSGITLVGRIGRSEETASAILFLASTRVIFLLGSIWRRLTASRRSELGGSARGHCAISAKSEQCSNRRHTPAGLPCRLGSFAPPVGPNSIGEEYARILAGLNLHRFQLQVHHEL
jgi:hypothetical protein